jgi:hypothetical protein
MGDPAFHSWGPAISGSYFSEAQHDFVNLPTLAVYVDKKIGRRDYSLLQVVKLKQRSFLKTA